MKKALSLLLALTMVFALVAVARPASADDEYFHGQILIRYCWSGTGVTIGFPSASTRTVRPPA